MAAMVSGSGGCSASAPREIDGFDERHRTNWEAIAAFG